MISGCKLLNFAGCCFIKYATSDEADRAIRALHNQRTLPGVSLVWSNINYMSWSLNFESTFSYMCFSQGVGPIQVRYADGERERLGNFCDFQIFGLSTPMSRMCVNILV